MEKKDYAWPVTEVLYEDYEELKKIVDAFREQLEEKRVLIFGSGIRGSMFLKLLEGMKVKVYGFIDNNKEKWDGVIAGYPIFSPEVLKDTENTVVIISVEACKEIEKQLELMGYEKQRSYFSVESDVYRNYITEVRRPLQDYTLIQGCCFLNTISMLDKQGQTQSLGDMLKEKLGSQNCKVLGMHGLAMGSFLEMLKLQVRLGNKPKRAIFCLNISSLANKYSYFPRAQHPVLFEQIQEFAGTGDGYGKFVEERRRRYENLRTDNSVEGSSNYSAERVAKLNFRMKYLCKTEENSESVNYVREAMQYCEEHNIEMKLVIDPVNYLFGENAFGEQFRLYYEGNVAFLKEIAAERGVEVTDLSYLLEKEDFPSEHSVTEISNYSGRIKVTEEIAAIA